MRAGMGYEAKYLPILLMGRVYSPLPPRNTPCCQLSPEISAGDLAEQLLLGVNSRGLPQPLDGCHVLVRLGRV